MVSIGISCLIESNWLSSTAQHYRMALRTRSGHFGGHTIWQAKVGMLMGSLSQDQAML